MNIRCIMRRNKDETGLAEDRLDQPESFGGWWVVFAWVGHVVFQRRGARIDPYTSLVDALERANRFGRLP